MAEKLKRGNEEAADSAADEWASLGDDIEWGDFAANESEDDKPNREVPSVLAVEAPFKGQRDAMTESHVERTPEESEKKEGGVVSWEKVKAIFNDGRYEILGHGTTSSKNADGILAEGLHVGDKSGYFARSTDIYANFKPLGNDDPDEMKAAMENWDHKDAKQIVLYRIPWRYKTAPGSGVEAYVPFYTGDEKAGTFNKEYAYGWYDAKKQEVHLNPDYHGDLDDEKDVAYLNREAERIEKHLHDSE